MNQTDLGWLRRRAADALRDQPHDATERSMNMMWRGRTEKLSNRLWMGSSGLSSYRAHWSLAAKVRVREERQGQVHRIE